MDSPTELTLETFSHRETSQRLRAWIEAGECRRDADRPRFLRETLEGTEALVPALLQALRAGEGADEFLERIEGPPRTLLVVMIQAGASAMGLWRGDQLLAHKAIKKYVVRGRGRAQPIHLKTKGKSRYGSRLRLRNAAAQLVQGNLKLREWQEMHGSFDDVFLSCPIRTLPVLFETKPPPPFERAKTLRIPFDVRVPDFGELKRIHRKMSRGRIMRLGED